MIHERLEITTVGGVIIGRKNGWIVTDSFGAYESQSFAYSPDTARSRAEKVTKFPWKKLYRAGWRCVPIKIVKRKHP